MTGHPLSPARIDQLRQTTLLVLPIGREQFFATFDALIARAEAAERERDALRAALESVLVHHDQFAATVLGPDLAQTAGDPLAIAQARTVLTDLTVSPTDGSAQKGHVPPAPKEQVTSQVEEEGSR